MGILDGIVEWIAEQVMNIVPDFSGTGYRTHPFKLGLAAF